METRVNAIEHLVSDMVVGSHLELEARRVALDSTRARELEQQVLTPLSGTANLGWGFDDVPVFWKSPFLYAPAQRDVSFEQPHFTYGIEIVSAADLIDIRAQVMGWHQTPEGWTVGATVRFMAISLGLDAVPYSAIAHLRFQGYATESE